MTDDNQLRLKRPATPVRSLLSHPWVESIVRFSAIEDTLAALHPMLSLTQVKARVVRIINETGDTKTFVLQTNALWQRTTQAGQFVRVQLEIDGRQVERVYSLSSRPGARRLAITVKRQEGGLMSQHLHQTLKPGSVLKLSQACGEFVLPAVLPEKILLLSAGSGITPVMAMLRDLQAREYQGDVVFLHICRNPKALIFAADLEKIAARFPALKLILHFTQSAARFTMDDLQATVPDLGLRSTWVCGPSALMEAVHDLWQTQAFPAALQSERFVAWPQLPATAPGTSVTVAFKASGKEFITLGNGHLLAQAERAGLRPKHGCRIGICRSCQCVKQSGTVENLQTGEVSSEPNQLVRLCISVARSDSVFDL